MLQREQDRIVAELDQVTRRIDAHFGDYAEARAHLDDALGLLGDCADIYTRCDDTNRRLCNQAFFTKVFIDEDNELRVEHNRPFEMQLDPQVNANALTWATDMEQGPNLDQRFHWQGFEPCAWGGPEGTRTPDPLHAMQVRYQLRHRPILWVVTAPAATLRCYYIRGRAPNRGGHSGASTGTPVGSTGQSFHRRSSP